MLLENLDATEALCTNPAMSLRILIAILFCLGAHPALAQLQWKSPTMFVAASPSEGKAVAQFSFTNAGDHPLRITGTKTTCGCTAAVADEQRSFAPGESGEVAVSFKTLNRKGLYEEPITVKTDDPAARETTLKLRVLVRDVLDVQPTFLAWRADEPLTPKAIHVKVTEGFSVKQISVSASDPGVTVHVDTVKPGADFTVLVTPKAQRVKATLNIRPEYTTSGGGEPKAFTAYIRTGY